MRHDPIPEDYRRQVEDKVWREFERINLRTRVLQILSDPPFLYENETEFLKNMAHWLKTSDPTDRQLAWIEKIERRPR